MLCFPLNIMTKLTVADSVKIIVLCARNKKLKASEKNNLLTNL